MTLAFASFAKGDALDYSVRAQSEDTFEVDVTGCRYAQFYKELGAERNARMRVNRIPESATFPPEQERLYGYDAEAVLRN